MAVQVSPERETLLLHLSGEIDLANSGELASALCPASMTSARRVIVDLSDVTYLDSASLNVLVNGKGTLDRYGTALRGHRKPRKSRVPPARLTRLSERFELPTELPERLGHHRGHTEMSDFIQQATRARASICRPKGAKNCGNG